MFTKLVIIGKLITVNDFYYNINEFDLQLLCDNLQYSSSNLQEAARLISYNVLLPNMKKGFRKNITEVFPIPSDKIDINKVKRESKINEESLNKDREKLNEVLKKLGKEEILI